MAMFVVPDGYINSNSDSDSELEVFDGNEEWNDNNFERAPPVRYQLTPKEIQQKKCDDFYSNLVGGNLTAVEEALKAGMDVNVEFKDDWTPLLLAASIGNNKIVQLLLDNRADIHKHKDYLTVLMASCKCPSSTASFEDSSSCVQLFIDNGIDINIKSRKRITALMYAASSGNHLAVEMLLPICDIHAVDNQGWHALFWAVNDKRINVVNQLIAAGLNLDQVDVRKQSLLEFAIAIGIDEIVYAIAPDRLNNNICKDYSDKTYSSFTDECSTLSDVTKKPYFYRDVSLLLYGSRSEEFLPQFMDNNIDLYSYLTMNEKGLQEIGISTPFQRYRILKGLYKFHKSPYKSKSVPVVKADAIATTEDISSALLCFIRQTIAMEASLQYLMNQEIPRNEKSAEHKSIASNIVEIKKKLKILKQLCAELEMLAEKSDAYNAKVDVLNQKSIKDFKRISIWYKFFCASAFVIGCFYINKKI